MENAQGLLAAAASLVALLALLRWISGGARRRAGSREPRVRVRGPATTWTHVGTRRRDLASTGSWRMRIR